MRVEELEITVELNKDQIDTLAYSLYYELRHSITSHYNSLQQEKDGEPVFYEQEGKKVELMKDLFGLIGCRDLCDSFIREFTRMFEEKRKDRDSSK